MDKLCTNSGFYRALSPPFCARKHLSLEPKFIVEISITSVPQIERFKSKGRLKTQNLWFSDDLFADSDKSNIVSGRCGIAAFACPVGVEEFATRFVGALVGVRAEVIALGLQQIGRQARGSVAV